MCTFLSSILVLIIFVTFYIDSASSYDALVIISNASNSKGISLPYKAEESKDGQIVYPDIEEYHKKIKYSFLCNSGNLNDVENPNIAYCLVENPGQWCENETKPLFTKERHRNKPETQCGKKFDHLSYLFAFNYCRITENFGIPKVSQLLLALYNICFDTVHDETLWTRHEVRTGLMLHPPGLPSQQIPTPEPQTLSTEPFSLPTKTFSKLAKQYTNQKANTYKMVPQLLVPHEDIALKIWKTTTTHYVNTAPPLTAQNSPNF